MKISAQIWPDRYGIAILLAGSAVSLILPAPLQAQSAGTGTIVVPQQAGDPASITPTPPTGSQSSPMQAAVAPEAKSADQLQDIVVTAQRRSESAQRVPISITAVSGETIAAAAIKDLVQLTKGIVGIQYDGNSTQRPELYIRGIGTDRFDIGSDPSSGVFIDDVYQPRFANVLTGLVDVERVEILRGPQGTLFGRNTVGGAISVTTASPSKEFEGLATGSYGNQNYVNAGGTVSGPLSDKILFRLSGGYTDRDGFMRDTVSGRDDGTQSLTFRGKVDFDLTEKLTFKIAGSYFYSHQKALLLNPVSTPIFVASPFVPQVIDNDPFSASYTTPGANTIKSTQVSGNLRLDGDNVTTTLIGAWISFRQRPSQDLDGNIIDSIQYQGNEHTDTYSGELRLTSSDGGSLTFHDHFKWVAGVFVYEDKGSDLQDFTFGRDSIISFLIANPTFTPPFAPATFRKVDSSNIFSDLKSVAVYGQGTFSITDRIGLTVGGRYTHDQRNFKFVGATTLLGFPSIPAPFVQPGSVSSSAFTPKIALEYKPTRDVLVYASWSRGFKSSAIQSTPISPLTASEVTRPERVDAYEIGLKSEFLQHRLRLNVALFDNEFKDLQVRRVVTFPGGFSTALSENAASSTIKGLEVEASALVAKGLRLNASYAYLDAMYNQYIVDPVAGIDFSGNRLPRAPKQRYNLDGTYTTEIAGKFGLQLRAAYAYTGSFFFQPSNLPIDKGRAYGLTDLSAQLTLPNKTTSLQVWGRNVFNNTYLNYLDLLAEERLAGYGDRATYGATLTQTF